MLDKAFADHFAQEWIDAWNARDVERVLAHYTDDFEMSSPVVIRVTGEPSGTLRGKEQVGAYWRRALELTPELRFELVHTLIGVDSIALYYHSIRGPVVEVLHLNAAGKVDRASAHYLPWE
ncbi:MAG TPA: nuclear transport factor 2 family protein [Gallionellaceae bacterium]|nr:nuclear transport factor 2 family protein [Gallionellaceae bacterium]